MRASPRSLRGARKESTGASPSRPGSSRKEPSGKEDTGRVAKKRRTEVSENFESDNEVDDVMHRIE